MYSELLQRMIDDRLEEQQADRAHLAVTPGEIDRGIASIAAQARAQQGRPVTVQQVLDEVLRRGMSVEDFREEMRRQILQGKLVELRIRPRVRVTEQDARAAYGRWVQEVAVQGSMQVPSYDEVKDEMMQRALADGLERVHKQWLEELRHNVYIDVRL